MTPELSHRERRVLIAGVVILGIAVLALRVLPAWRAWQDDVERRAAHRVRQASQAEAEVTHLPEALDTLGARRERLATLDMVLIRGPTRAAAEAALATHVSDMAAQANVRVDALDLVVDTTDTGSFTRVRARLDATTDIRGLSTFLAVLQRARPLLAVHQVSVSQPDPSPQLEMPENLRIELVVEGLASADAGAKAARTP